jgi:hypothetical protein
MVYRLNSFQHYTTLTFEDLVRLIDHADAVMVNSSIATNVEADTEHGIFLEYIDKETEVMRSCIWQAEDSLSIWITPKTQTIKVATISYETTDEIKLLIFMKL